MPKPLIMLTQHLADVLDRENAALRAMDLRGAVTLLPEKTSAIAALTAADAVAEPPNSDLTSMTTRLDGLAQENRVLLERAIGVQQRVIGIVVRAAASVAVAPHYGLQGLRAPLTGPMALSTRA